MAKKKILLLFFFFVLIKKVSGIEYRKKYQFMYIEQIKICYSYIVACYHSGVVLHLVVVNHSQLFNSRKKRWFAGRFANEYQWNEEG